MFDALVDGGPRSAVSVRHDAHVVVVDVTMADSDVIGLIDANAGTVVASVGRAG